MSAPVYIFIMMDSGETHRVMEFQTRGRSPTLPFGAKWIGGEGGAPTDGVPLNWWSRSPTAENVASEVTKSCPLVDAFGVRLPQPVSHRIVDRAELPTDREYRDAWTHDGVTVTHDMQRAKAIHLTKLRAARARLFVELDAEWMKATGQKDSVTADAIEEQRQVLRDLPSLDTVTTIEELKQVRLVGQ